MADFSNDPRGGQVPYGNSQYAVPASGALGRLTNLAGAAVSLALIVGVGVWGYELLVRDVSGIPVVRAISGEMRVRPEEPGGQLARHQGLSVNTVAAVGSTSARADAVRLAPGPVVLTEDDKPMPELIEATTEPEIEVEQDRPLTQQEATDLAVADALGGGSVQDLVAQLTDGVAPLEALEGEVKPVLASISAEALPGRGMRASLRPAVRPARAGAVRGTPAAAPRAVPENEIEIEIASLAAGTRLVQLGAFDSVDIARAQWGKLAQRFAPFMEGKSRIVQEATSGGRIFYRLRAHGFEDIGDARRFCSALVAENVDCIPVVTR